MAKPTSVSSSTRRRSNSTASSGGGASQDGKPAHKMPSASTRPQRRSGRESTRPKRKLRGLPSRARPDGDEGPNDPPSPRNGGIQQREPPRSASKTDKTKKSSSQQSPRPSSSGKAQSNGNSAKGIDVASANRSGPSESNGFSSPRSNNQSPRKGRLLQPLVARGADDKEFYVRIIVGSEFINEAAPPEPSSSRKRARGKSIDDAKEQGQASPDPATTPPKTPPPQDDVTPTPSTAIQMGNDGNLFHCSICRGFGDVVCCDGCPRVLHHTCVPEGSASRISLDNDDEPWYCPECTEEGKISEDRSVTSSTTPPRTTGKAGERRAVKRRCCECHQSGGQNPLEPCESCGTYLHFPSCKGLSASPTSMGGSILCSTCRSEMALAQEETELVEEDKNNEFEKSIMEQSKRKSGHEDIVESGAVDDDDDDDYVHETASTNGAPSESTKKRKHQGDADDSSPSSPKSGETPRKKKSEKKRKKKKQMLQRSQDADGDSVDNGPGGGLAAFQLMTTPQGLAKAVPAFYFFLGENRFKIERVLGKKHRYFYRLPKGPERNQLVAKEAAILWAKLDASEAKQYIDLSMRDFERRIIEWKEEKNIRDMMAEAAEEDAGLAGSTDKEQTTDDEMQTFLTHERLYLGTTVGSKPFKPEPGESHNRVLLELLQDMRFHPVPMFAINRTKTEYGQIDHQHATVPYFDVHGPISTNVGDECLGCTRGWAHVCSVLKRRIPAVDNRAKLQPPLSSLLATRIGLGLRNRAARAREEDEDEDSKNAPFFVKRKKPGPPFIKHLPAVPVESMTSPTVRGDDIVQFIEETISMKVPEPPRPQAPGTGLPESPKKSTHGRGILPTRGKKKSADYESYRHGNDIHDHVVNKCGRCRTVIQTDTGCIQCRRAQLVINLSKRAPKESPILQNLDNQNSKTLKVHTHMLGRVTMKEGSGEFQSKGDQAIAAGILKQRWAPCAILPPQALRAPDPNAERFSPSDQSSDDESQSLSIDDDEADDTNSPLATVDGKASTEEGNTSFDSPVPVGNSRYASVPSSASAPTLDPTSDPTLKSSKRIRSARIVAAASTNGSDSPEEEDRQQLAEKFQEESNELQKKTISIACCGILLALMRRDPLLLFASPVTVEGYSLIIRNPTDFGKIRKNVLAGKYPTLGAFVSDARILCTNALAYNPPGSIYWKTAKELLDVLLVMQKRASGWIGAIKDAHASACRRASNSKFSSHSKDMDDAELSDDDGGKDRFDQLRREWPEAMEMLENGDWLRRCLSADFMRTKENEAAYYGSLAVRRAAVAAETSLAPYPTSSGMFSTVSRRSHIEDESLRNHIDARVAEITDPVELKDMPTWREESIVRVMRRTQSRRLDGRTGSENGCARCDGIRIDQELKTAMHADVVRLGRSRRKGDQVPRVAPSRINFSMGSASHNAKERIKQYRATMNQKTDPAERYNSANKAAVSVNGSRIHGWGLFAEQAFKKGDVVAEYVGEYVSLAVTEAREKMYQDQRIQDYQFRLDDSLVIDATLRGGHGRYINHNCNPNCKTEIIPGLPPNQHLKRVIIIAARDIKSREELSYDYQFPLEIDLEARIPCNCQSDQCRGFMNWDLPEKGSNNLILRSQKRGANMRDRIRRLGRPLKGEK